MSKTMPRTIRKTPRRLTAIFVVLGCLGGPALAGASSLEALPLERALTAVEYVGGEILVRFHPGIPEARVAEVHAERGVEVLGKSEIGGFWRLAVPAGRSELELAELYAADAGCEWASLNFVAHSLDHAPFPIPPNDPFYPFQTHLALIDIEGAWSRQIGSEEVVVAVLDSGVAYENRPIPAYELPDVLPGKTDYFLAPDLAQTHFVPGFDFIHGDAFANDDRFHGTGVAATITQDTDNGFRAAGVAPGVTIMPVKVLNRNGAGSLATVIDGIAFATASGVDVINMSLGFSPGASDPIFDPFFAGLDAALDAAHAAGIVVVAASGNAGVGVVSRPALHPTVVAVGASNFDGLSRAGYSQFSTLEAGMGIPPTPGLPGSIEIMAPVGDGSDKDGNGIADAVVQEIIFPNCPDQFGAFLLLGTSFASPQVAGVAGLMISEGQRPGKDGVAVDVLRQILRETATDLGAPGSDLVFGAGQVDAGAAVAARKVNVCHRPPGNPANAKTLSVAIAAAPAHVAHGDTLGACP